MEGIFSKQMEINTRHLFDTVCGYVSTSCLETCSIGYNLLDESLLLVLLSSEYEDTSTHPQT